MLSELTSLKLQAAALELEIDQRKGQAPPPGQITIAEYARRAGLSENTIKKVERMALDRLSAALLQDPELPPHLARAAVSALTERGL